MKFNRRSEKINVVNNPMFHQDSFWGCEDICLQSLLIQSMTLCGNNTWTLPSPSDIHKHMHTHTHTHTYVHRAGFKKQSDLQFCGPHLKIANHFLN